MSGWTKERHEVVKARCEAATGGPWVLWRDGQYVGGGEDICIGAGKTWLANMDHRGRPHEDPFPMDGWLQVSECDILSIDSGEITREQLANAEFLSHSRTDLPDALAEIERLRQEVGLLQEINTKNGETWLESIRTISDLEARLNGR